VQWLIATSAAATNSLVVWLDFASAHHDTLTGESPTDTLRQRWQGLLEWWEKALSPLERY
jgi:hypothetical protein